MFASEWADDGDGRRSDVKAATVAAAAAAEEEAEAVVTPLAELGSSEAASKRCWGAMEDALM